MSEISTCYKESNICSTEFELIDRIASNIDKIGGGSVEVVFTIETLRAKRLRICRQRRQLPIAIDVVREERARWKSRSASAGGRSEIARYRYNCNEGWSERMKAARGEKAGQVCIKSQPGRTQSTTTSSHIDIQSPTFIFLTVFTSKRDARI